MTVCFLVFFFFLASKGFLDSWAPSSCLLSSSVMASLVLITFVSLLPLPPAFLPSGGQRSLVAMLCLPGYWMFSLSQNQNVFVGFGHYDRDLW